MGLLPDEFWEMTFKEFYYYSFKVEREEEREWQRQSVMMALHANMQGGKKSYAPDEFNPFSGNATTKDTVSDKQQILDLRQRIAERNKRFNKQK